MKYWIVFILFLSSLSSAIACGPWYPYGEDTRFSLLDPGMFDNGSFTDFYYSYDNFGEAYEFSATSDQNTNDWWILLDKKVEKEIVFEALYGLTSADVELRNNKMIIELLSSKGDDYVDYLIFAKNHSHLNNRRDYWERDESYQDSARDEIAKKALKKAKRYKDPWLKRRYAFLALRYYYYNNDESSVTRLYNQYFKNQSEWAIDRWAEYHYLRYEKDPEIRNFRVAQLFNSVPSKRRPLWRMHYENFLKDDVLQHASKNKEKANVLSMYSIRNRGRSLADLKKIYQLHPTNKVLKMLVVREINKIENWVLGPRINSFNPVIHPEEYDYNVEEKIVNEGILEDQKYAIEVLKWLEKEALVLDKEMRIACISTLALITKDFEKGIELLKESSFASKDLRTWKTNMLNLLKINSLKSPTLKDIELERIITADYTHKKEFIFALGRTFEFKDNLTAAFLLFANINKDDFYYTSFSWSESDGTTVYNKDFYSRAYDYFDANYLAVEVENCLAAIEKLDNDAYYKCLTSYVLSDKWNWVDLVGTKYLREDKLKKAEKIWRQVPSEYWSSDSHNYKEYLDANPFYANLYSSHKPTKGDTIKYNKLEVVQELIRRMERSKILKGDDKALELFHIANCYFNMTQYGNSWMMKRYYWTINIHETIYIDDADYNRCVIAKKYYLAAKDVAKTRDFKALCLRMAGRCESYNKRMSTDYYDFQSNKYADYNDYIFETNRYFQELKTQYPEDQDQLITNCYSFDRYYNSIR